MSVTDVGDKFKILELNLNVSLHNVVTYITVAVFQGYRHVGDILMLVT